MPRSGPIYTLPEAAFVPNTVISSAAVNDDFSDIGDALTNSLARNGAGGMTAVLPLANTGFIYLADPNTGMSRSAADTQVITCGGTDIITITPTLVAISGRVDAGTVTQNGHRILLTGEIKIWSGLAAPAEWLFCSGATVLRADFPSLWTFAAAEIAGGNLLFTNGNGTTTFTLPDFRGRVPAGSDGSGRLTSATITPNPITLGGSGGAQTYALTANENGAHTHSVFAGVETHSHATTTNNGASALSSAGGSTNYAAGANGAVSLSTGLTVNAAATGLTVRDTAAGGGNPNVTAASGSGAAHLNVQPTLICNYIIYAGA